jgi:triose/dihydroxyacetone kinase / FAD-AMP lyase (cyclizing)
MWRKVRRKLMPHFVNAYENIVTDALEGLLLSSSGAHLARLDGFPGTKVIINRKHSPNKVAVVSGGGSGHEPAHAGFVGRGMLAAAVCGEIFASPSVDAVLAAILAVTGKAGCLLVVKNYTGDRLNFGLAAEKARAMGKKVAMVIVADDISIDGHPKPRGIAGTLIVHKIAGYFAERGRSLEVVTAKASAVAKEVVTCGVALSTCNVPGNAEVQRIPDGKAELGLGIHGEPGANVIELSSATNVAELIRTKLLSRVKKSTGYAMLINNLGGMTALEMNIVSRALLTGAKSARITHVIGPAPLMTALDMQGFSVSLMPLSAEITTALGFAVEPKCWPGLQRMMTTRLVGVHKSMTGRPFTASKNEKVRTYLLAACDQLIKYESHLNELDSKIGDGDTGTTIAAAAFALKKNIDVLPLAHFDELCSAISKQLMAAMGGSSGVLLAILFASAAATSAEGRYWTIAFLEGLNKVKHYGGAKLGDRTMIDALEPALQNLANGKTLRVAASVARQGADATAVMQKAAAGRASYVPSSNLDGIVDPGAEAVALLFEALADAKLPGMKA